MGYRTKKGGNMIKYDKENNNLQINNTHIKGPITQNNSDIIEFLKDLQLLMDKHNVESISWVKKG